LIAAGTSPVPYSAASATLEADGTIKTTDASGDKDNRSVMGGTHVAAMYGSTKKGLFLSAAMDNFTEDGYGIADDYTQTSLAAQYKMGGLTANVMVREFDGDVAGVTNGRGTFVNAAYKMGKMTVKGKVMRANRDNNVPTAHQVAIGLAYSLGKYTTAYAYNTTKDKYFDTDASDGRQTNTQNYVGLVHNF